MSWDTILIHVIYKMDLHFWVYDLMDIHSLKQVERKYAGDEGVLKYMVGLVGVV
jgi:hypothetical protein